jgi:hypothetical protein
MSRRIISRRLLAKAHRLSGDCAAFSMDKRIAARNPHRQTDEIQISIALMNRFSALGTAEIVRVA